MGYIRSAFVCAIVLFSSSFLKAFNDHSIGRYSILVNESTVMQYLNLTRFTFIAILSDLHSGDKLRDCILLMKELSVSKNITLLHTNHGSKANLAKYFNLTYTDVPLYLLFHYPILKPTVYRGSWKSEDILRWIVNQTGLQLALPGCITSFDVLARQFRDAKSIQEQNQLLLDMKKLGSSVEFISSKYAQFYQYVARKTLDVGPVFLSQETTRLKKLIDGEVADELKTELKRKLNIITQFAKPSSNKHMKTEL